METKRTRRRWTFLLSALAVVALTGCGMYPSKPGAWPPNFWGTVLHGVSDGIDFFAHLFGGSYGIAILVVTVIIRLIILPLFIRQLRYQKVMMELQPQMQKIRSKYKGDNQKIQQETMKLYQEAGTNPAAGCLPMVIQLPVLYALYGAIMGNPGLHQASFLGIQLGEHEPHFPVLAIIAGLSTFLSSWLTMKNQPTQQRAVLYIMPLFIIFIGLRLPAGLVLYWVYTNLLTALQTYVFLSRPRAKAAAEAAAAGGPPVNVKAKSVSTSSRSTGAKQGGTGKSSSQGAAKSKSSSSNKGKSKSSKTSGTSGNPQKKQIASDTTVDNGPKVDDTASQSSSENTEKPSDGRTKE